jgi:hypothetical protein
MNGACSPIPAVKTNVFKPPNTAIVVTDMFERKLHEHDAYIRQHLDDMPEVKNWVWTADYSEPKVPPPLAKGQPGANLFSDA